MRDTLPIKKYNNECGIVNLDDNTGNGTHWVAYFYVNNQQKIYFDSFGLDPPVELKQYLGHNILTQTFQLQDYGDVICGHLCLHVLYELSKNKMFKDIILNLI
jgi:hypothetical protein